MYELWLYDFNPWRLTLPPTPLCDCDVWVDNVQDGCKSGFLQCIVLPNTSFDKQLGLTPITSFVDYSNPPPKSPNTLLLPICLAPSTFFLNTSFRLFSFFSNTALLSASRACAWILLLPVPPLRTLPSLLWLVVLTLLPPSLILDRLLVAWRIRLGMRNPAPTREGA